MSSSPVTELPDEGDAAPAATAGGDRSALGVALRSRSVGIADEVGVHFPARIRTEVEAAARQATEAVGRWLATGDQGADPEQRAGAQAAMQAILVESDLPTAVGAYLSWRDLCETALADDAARQGIAADTVNLARAFVRLRCDGGLIRMARAFDQGSQALQVRVLALQAGASRQALFDDLTGLPNRVLLADRLAMAVRSGVRRMTRSMVLSLDLDNFTAINDRFGRAAGDALLVEVAHRLGGLVRASDTVARLTADEFVILAEDLEDPDEAARSLAERIHQAMCAPVAVGDRELHTSVSIGIAEVTSAMDPETALTRAGAAMLRARSGGPARYAVYDLAGGGEAKRGERLADELRMAQSRGDLSLDFQPIVRLDDGAPEGIAGVEALLRWVHPELGTVDPTVFVPMLEQSRQIVPVGRWVLEEAASQCVEWQRRIPGLTVSVNVSARQLHDAGFLEDVADALRRSGLDPADLVLEVTEQDLVVDVARIGTALEAVRGLGVSVALDHFGAGHSSLLYLQGLPIDRLKVDRAFVTGLEPDGHGATVVRTVVDLAHRLGIGVVAEGVESAAELRAVGAIGCDEAQGLLLGPPVPAHLQEFDVPRDVASHA